uniref:DUF3019 domain-containing protein n=1 Tax=Cellvibrio fontiphilus TaxID=1815559 RepID=UPI002B4BBEAA|nr:DUF3019 domain-containing protein [Cellvibrio fontiphilus]
MRRFLTAVLFAAVLPGSPVFASDLHPAESSANTSSLPLIQFSIKPRLCVLNAGEEVCRDELEVRWQAAQKRSLCLYQQDKIQPLRCWQDATQGEYQFELTASASTNFELRETETGTALSDQRFQVVYNDKKYRRARRNPWSFF